MEADNAKKGRKPAPSRSLTIPVFICNTTFIETLNNPFYNEITTKYLVRGNVVSFYERRTSHGDIMEIQVKCK